MGGIRRAWADGTLIYEEGVGAFPSNWTFYPGTDTQPGDPQIGFAPVTPTDDSGVYLYLLPRHE